MKNLYHPEERSLVLRIVVFMLSCILLAVLTLIGVFWLSFHIIDWKEVEKLLPHAATLIALMFLFGILNYRYQEQHPEEAQLM